MAYKVIELPDVVPEPGGTSWTSTRFDSFVVAGRQDEPIVLTLKVRNWSRISDRRIPYFEVEFAGVLEYRYIGDTAYYEDFKLHERDYKFGLIEILGSAYIENMALKGSRRDLPIGQRFGKYDDDPASGGIFEADVRHFRFAQDEWGKLDIIALSVHIRAAHSG